MGKIISPKDLSQESISLILQEHFNNSKLKVISLNGNETFLSKNDNFNSDIKKWTVKFQTEEEDGKTFFFQIIFKTQKKNFMKCFAIYLSFFFPFLIICAQR